MKKEEKKILPTSRHRLGGGTLSKKAQPDGLKQFNKNGKQKRIVISAIIGLILLVGGITLYRTFALYEEKKEFNVLEGKVPSLNYDVKFAVLVDSEKRDTIPAKNSGYYLASSNCSNGATIKWDYENWAPIVVNFNKTNTVCSLNFETGKSIYDQASIGDYVSYTPEKTSYKIMQNLTGYANEQSIKPNELNLWRIIRKNDDGTVDLVSEYATNEEIYFQGRIGYEFMIGSLNIIAEQYETDGITVGSRHMGYSNQSYMVTVNDTFSSQSSSGVVNGADESYTMDIDLVTKSIGTTIAYKPNTTTAVSYWIASRSYWYISVNDWRYMGRQIKTDGNIQGYDLYQGSAAKGWTTYSKKASIRPIVTLRSGFVASEGTKNGKKLWTIN